MFARNFGDWGWIYRAGAVARQRMSEILPTAQQATWNQRCTIICWARHLCSDVWCDVQFALRWRRDACLLSTDVFDGHCAAGVLSSVRAKPPRLLTSPKGTKYRATGRPVEFLRGVAGKRLHGYSVHSSTWGGPARTIAACEVSASWAGATPSFALLN